MDDEPLRLLGLWVARRRLVDEALAPLLLHGPAAVERVSDRLELLTAAIESERAAFAAFTEAVAHTDPTDDVARERIRAAVEAARRADHPAFSGVEVDEVVIPLDLHRRRLRGGPGQPA